ncbi:MAG TPA: M4 family metallopeptidase [Nitrososphaeraceae archaeon]|nr:M4 family metallopeptidase [Nitrososphaeraceae archaeon]
MKYPVCNIIPPDMLKELLAEVEEEEKNKVLRTLMIDTRMREHRSILGSMPAIFPLAAEKDICIYDAQNTRNVRTSTRVRCVGDPKSNDKAVNEAYDGFDATYDLYKTVYGRKSIDDNNFALKGYVHWGQDYVNAFWDGTKMCFGDGNPRIGIDGFTSAIDVMAHELTHGVTQYEAALEYWCDRDHHPGAINESISDVFGSLVKQYVSKQTADKADWLIGHGLFTDTNIALRSMKAPGTARPNDPQPAHIRDYRNLPTDEDNDNGGVHINSGIPNKAFYTTAVEIGGYAWEKAGLIWYKTLGSGLHTDCSFQEFADHTFVEAGNLFGVGKSEQDAVRKGWQEVGIKV